MPFTHVAPLAHGLARLHGCAVQVPFTQLEPTGQLAQPGTHAPFMQVEPTGQGDSVVHEPATHEPFMQVEPAGQGVPFPHEPVTGWHAPFMQTVFDGQAGQAPVVQVLLVKSHVVPSGQSVLAAQGTAGAVLPQPISVANESATISFAARMRSTFSSVTPS
jgi:hypothetical protein